MVYTYSVNPLSYVTLPTSMDYFTFGLTACENVAIALTTAPGVTDSQTWMVVMDEYQEGVYVTQIYSTDNPLVTLSFISVTTFK